MADTLVILNPSAGGGRAGVVWSQIEPVLWETLGDLVVAVTHHPEDVARHLKEARDVGLTRVVAIGGDGTNHAIVNAIQRLADADPAGPRITYGQLPIGTGQDFARMLGIPRDPVAAVEWLARAQPRAVDLGCLERGEVGKRYFLNIASVGIGGEVDRRVNAIHRRRPWTFKLATLKSFLTYQPRHMKVYTDGDEWYNDRAWAVVIANGQNFGHGMAIAPDARIDDGLFDVILIEDASRMNVILAFNTVYSGKHLARQDVHHCRAQTITIESCDGILDLDLDGEHATGEKLDFRIKPGALSLLVGEE